MKRILFLLLTIFSIVIVKAQSIINVNAQYESAKTVYKASNLKEIVATHKTVAILPFTTNISYRKPPKNYDDAANTKKENEMAENIQSSMYTYLLRKASQYTVTFQDVEKTNILLKRAGVFDKLKDMTQDEIAKILGVDAVIHGNFQILHTGSEAGAIVTTILIGTSKTASGTLTMEIGDGKSGDNIWRFTKSMNESLFNSTDNLVDRMMRKVSRNFPYAQ